MADISDLSGTTLERQSRQLETLDRLAQRFGSSLKGALSGGTSSGRELSGVLDRVATSLAGSAVQGLGSALQGTMTALLQGASQALTQNLSALSFGGALPFARGGVLSGGGVVPFASAAAFSSFTSAMARSRSPVRVT